MASAIIARPCRCRKLCPLLPKALQLFHDILSEPYTRGSIKTLLYCWLQVVDQLQQATKSTPRVTQFSASSSIGILPLPEMEESWDGGANLEDQCMRTLPCHPYLLQLHDPDYCQASLDHLRLRGEV